MPEFAHVKALICNLTDKSNKNLSTNLQPTNLFSQSFLCKVQAVAFMVFFPLEGNIIFYIKLYINIIIYFFKYLFKYLMSAVSSLAIICFAGKCQVKSRLLFFAKPGQKAKVHLAQDSVR